MTPARQLGRNRWAGLWPLRPEVAYLNHGSFGACPTAVLEHQRRLRDEMEREPVDFLGRELPLRLEEARRTVAEFVGADPEGLVFVTNATNGVNAVLRSLELRPGDELLTTDHAYAACRKTLEWAAACSGARVAVAAVPFPLDSEDQLVDAVLSAVRPRTRLAMIDHVTSPTALIVPVARLVRELDARGIETLVDGAHALGMIPLDLRAIGATYYTANAHKWLCAPKGAAILVVREDRRAAVHPTTISHGYEPGLGRARFREEFDWQGTVDPTAWLTIPECIRYLGSLLEGGWPPLMERNRALALRARAAVGRALGVAPPCPDGMVGAMASLPLPTPAPASPAATLDHEALMRWLRERDVEGWFHPWPCPGGKVTRLSAQLYNDDGQYRVLAATLAEAVHGVP